MTLQSQQDIPEDGMRWLRELPAEDLRRIVEALYSLHRGVAKTTDLDVLLDNVMHQGKLIAGAEAASLILYDPATDELYFEVALGDTGDQGILKREIRLRSGEGIAGAAALERRSIHVPDAERDTRFFRSADEMTNFHTRNILAVPLLDRGELIGVLEVLNKRDGGAFTEADLRLMEIFASLTATVVANARLFEQNRQQERLAAIGEAIAGLSHHAKNIITGMGGCVDLIDQSLAANSLDIVEKTWPILKRSATRITNFVEDMLSFSKQRAPVRQFCSPIELVRDVQESYAALLQRKQVEVTVTAEPDIGKCDFDPRGLFRCLLNLVVNASEAVPQENGHIWIRLRRTPGGALEMEVADNGPGIPEELRHKVCDPFFSTKGSRGTGLGLAVTAKIIHEHGGRLEISQHESGGALFRITLPQSVESK